MFGFKRKIGKEVTEAFEEAERNARWEAMGTMERGIVTFVDPKPLESYFLRRLEANGIQRNEGSTNFFDEMPYK